MLTIFLAILEIIKKQIAVATQENFDSDIYLEHNAAGDKELNDGELLKDVDEYN